MVTEFILFYAVQWFFRIHDLGKAELKILETLREQDKNNTASIVHMKEHFYFRNHLCITFQLFE